MGASFKAGSDAQFHIIFTMTSIFNWQISDILLVKIDMHLVCNFSQFRFVLEVVCKI